METTALAQIEVKILTLRKHWFQFDAELLAMADCNE